jgi:hypothetical protein
MKSSRSTGARTIIPCSRFFFLLIVLGAAGAGCSLLATRPVQEMSDTSAALRAAKEVQADTLAPELFREANEWFLRARNEYKFKNFEQAKAYAVRARHLAEQAEFETIRSGGTRSESPPDMNASTDSTQGPRPASPATDYATPTGTPVENVPANGGGTSTPSAPSTPSTYPAPAPAPS